MKLICRLDTTGGRRIFGEAKPEQRLAMKTTAPPAELPLAGFTAARLKLFGLTCLSLSANLCGWTAEPPATKPVPLAQAAGALEFEQLANIKVTSVARSESTVQQSPAAVFVITQEDIRRSGAKQIAELFRMVPGMDVARIDNNKWAISARGFNDRFVGKQLVQMDGRTLYNPLTGGVYWDGVDYPLEDIERIEIIRGPGGSLWGANAVNGVINIITKSAKDTQGGLLSGGGGTEERGSGQFRYGGKAGEDLYVRVYGKGFEREQQFSQEGDTNDGWRSGRGGFRLDWLKPGPNTLTLEGDFFRSVAGRTDSRPTTNAPPFFYRNVENEVTSGSDFLARWSHEVDQDSNWQLQAYWDRFERRTTSGLFAFGANSFDLDFQHQLALGERQKIVYGAGYRLNDLSFQGSTSDGALVNNAFAVGPALTQRNTQLLSVFVQDQIMLVDERLRLTLGSKFEHNDYTGFEYQPSGRLLWTPTPRQSAWFAVSRAVKTPTLLENEIQVGLLPGGIGGTNFIRTLPNSNLSAEELLSFELGYRAQPTDKFSFDLALFYNEYDNLVVPVPGAQIPGFPTAATSTTPLTRDNQMHGESYGVELGTNYRLADWWRVSGAYTFLSMQLHRTAAGVSVAAEGQSPQNQVHLQSSWNLSRHAEFDLIGRWVDKLPGFAPAIPAYYALDARLAWRPRKNLEFEVVGQNLLDSHHPESGSSPLVKAPLVELRRGVYGKVTWRF